MSFRQPGCLFLLCCACLDFNSLAQTPATVKWTVDLHASQATLPAVGPDGSIYWGTSAAELLVTQLPGGVTITTKTGITNRISKLASTGIIEWQVDEVSSDIAINRESLAIAVDGKIVTTTEVLPGGGASTTTSILHQMLHLGSNGDALFRNTSGSRLALGTDDSIYSSTWISEGTDFNGTNAFALNADRSLRWVIPLADWLNSAPLIGPDSTIYFTTRSKGFFTTLPGGGAVLTRLATNTVVAVRHDGTVRWKSEAGWAYAPSAVGNDGRLLAAVSKVNATPSSPSDPEFLEYGFRAFAMDGTTVWTFPSDEPLGAAVIGDAGVIYVTGTNSLFALTSAGEQIWRYSGEPFGRLSPALAMDGTIYVTVTTGKLLALNSNGTLRWQYATSAGMLHPPTIGPDGTVFILAGGTNLVALHGSAPPANTDWPQYQHDSQRTGRAFQSSALAPVRANDGIVTIPLNLEVGSMYRVQAIG